MCSHKSNEYMSYCELHNHNQTVFVASDVKDIMLIPNVVCRWEVYLYVRQVLPLCPFGDVIPPFKCSLSVSMTFRTIELN